MNDIPILAGHTYVRKDNRLMYIIHIDEDDLVTWREPFSIHTLTNYGYNEFHEFKNTLGAIETVIMLDTTVSYKPLPEPDMWDFIKI